MESRREYWDRVGHKSACPVWGDEEMIESCTCMRGRTALPLRPGSSREAVMNNYWVQAANAPPMYDSIVIDSITGLQEQMLKDVAEKFLDGDYNAAYRTSRITPTTSLVDIDYTDAELRLAALYGSEDPILHHTRKKEKDMATSQKQLELRRARLERELERAEVELERIANLQEEPAVDSVVSFEKTYEVNGKNYSWVAYHAKQGCWYLSQDGLYGAREPKKTWFELLEFIGDNTIYLATAWEELV